MSKILIIEDQPEIRALFALTFENAGHRVLVAATGEEGLMLAASSFPDLILLDIMLPRMSGHEVLERLRKAKDTAEIPVIVVTASSDARQTLSWQVGAANAFEKPVDLDVLLQRAEEILLQ